MARYDEILEMVKNVWNNLETVNTADSIDNYPKCKYVLRFSQEKSNVSYIVEMTKALLADFPKAEVSPFIIAQYLDFCQKKEDFLPRNLGNIGEILDKLSAKEKFAEEDWGAYNLLLPFVMHEFIKEIRTIRFTSDDLIERFCGKWNQIMDCSLNYLPADTDIWEYSLDITSKHNTPLLYRIRTAWQEALKSGFQESKDDKENYIIAHFGRQYLRDCCNWAWCWNIRLSKRLLTRTRNNLAKIETQIKEQKKSQIIPPINGIVSLERLRDDMSNRIKNYADIFFEGEIGAVEISSTDYWSLRSALISYGSWCSDEGWIDIDEKLFLDYFNVILQKLSSIKVVDHISLLGFYDLLKNVQQDFLDLYEKHAFVADYFQEEIRNKLEDKAEKRKICEKQLKDTYPWVIPYLQYIQRLCAILETPQGESVQHIIDAPSGDGTTYEFSPEMLSLRFDAVQAQAYLDHAIQNALAEIDEKYQDADWDVVENVLSKHLCPEFAGIMTAIEPRVEEPLSKERHEIIETTNGKIYPQIFGVKNTYWELFFQYRKHKTVFVDHKFKTPDNLFNFLDKFSWKGAAPLADTVWGDKFRGKLRKYREKFYPMIIKITRLLNMNISIRVKGELLLRIMEKCQKYTIEDFGGATITITTPLFYQRIWGVDEKEVGKNGAQLLREIIEINDTFLRENKLANSYLSAIYNNSNSFDDLVELGYEEKKFDEEKQKLLEEQMAFAEEKHRMEIEDVKKQTEIETRQRVLFELSHSIKNLVASVSEPLVLLRDQLTGNQQRTVKNALAGAGLIRDLANGVHMSMRGEPGLWRKDVQEPGRNALTLEMILLEAVRHAVSNMFDGKYFTEFSRKYFNDIDIFYAARDEWENADTFEKVNLCLNKYFFDFKLDIQKGTLDIPVGDGEGTATKLLIMFQELLLNAVKYSSLIPKEKRFIHINAATTPEYWHFEFKNSASKEQQRKSFGIGTSVLDNFSKLFESEYSVKFENDFYQTNMVFTVKSKEA